MRRRLVATRLGTATTTLKKGEWPPGPCQPMREERSSTSTESTWGFTRSRQPHCASCSSRDCLKTSGFFAKSSEGHCTQK